MEKCNYGYINREKRKKLLITLLYAVIGVAIFFTGYFLNGKTKSNIFTVIAILLVLPAAKHFVAFIVLAPFKTLAKSEYDRLVAPFSEEDTVLSDYVFTSAEKVMGLHCLVLSAGNVFGLAANEKQDIDYINHYLKEGVRKLSPECHVKIVKDEKEFYRLYQKKTQVSISDNQKQAVEDWLRSLAV